MLEYVLTISILWEDCCNIYAGSFDSCARAQQYYDVELAEDFKGMSCLHEDYVVLPPDFHHQAPILLPRIDVTPPR